MKPNRLAVYGLAAGLLGGGAAGLALTGASLASAQVSDVTGTVTDPAATTDSTVADSTTTTEAPATTSSGPATTTTDPALAAPAPADGSAKPAKGDWAKSVLDGLVAKGTITQAQADEVLAALKAARPDRPKGRGFAVGKLDAAASALGMTVEELRTALQGGQSLADVARAKGVDVAKVVEALVAQMKTHLDQHVASGQITQAEADQRLADARARIRAFVNGEVPAGKPGLGLGRGGRGHGPKPGAPADGTAPTSTSSSGGTITS